MVHWKWMDFYTICSPVTVKWINSAVGHKEIE